MALHRRRTGLLLFSGSDEGNFYALDAESGKPLWDLQAGWPINANPVAFTVHHLRTSVHRDSGEPGAVRVQPVAGFYDVHRSLPARVAFAPLPSAMDSNRVFSVLAANARVYAGALRNPI